MLGTVSRRMRAVNISGLVMGAFMSIHETLKFRWVGSIVRSINYWFSISISNSHSGRYLWSSPTSLNEMDRLSFIV